MEWELLRAVLDKHPEIEDAIGSAQSEFSAYVTDPFRCDGCEGLCDCDADRQYELVESLVDKYPILHSLWSEVSEKIDY